MRRAISSLTTVSVATLAALASGDAWAATGGPDAFGYRLADQGSGAPFNFIDITATGMQVATGDEQLGGVALGAPFEFYGVLVNNVQASTNGFITSTNGISSDFTNDCPIPANAGGGGFRIAPLHDDFITDVYYQYLDEVAASAAGFPGETAGISVFQWTGEHYPSGGGDPVEFEAILFHDDFSILTMVSTDVEAGLSSTLGIQNEDASIGLNYVCNTGGSVIPGVTAVLYTLGPAPDSTCCAASPTGSAGCVNAVCQDTVCSLDLFCCDTAWDGICAMEAGSLCGVLCGPPPPVNINEIRIDQAGADNDEYFELVGPPGTLLTDIQYIVIGDTPTGTVEAVVDLTGLAIPPTGHLAVAEGTFSIGTADYTFPLIFENNDTVTHMLVGGFSGSVGDNLDPNADGLLDTTPWLVMLDDVAIVHPASTDLPYGPPNVCAAGPLCQEVNDGIDAAFHVRRCPDGDGVWVIGNDDLAILPRLDTPRNPNICGSCSDGAVDPGEDCDDAGESVTCDVDCTFVSCGDGVANATAGEDCDHIGESATCNADCTFAACGDSLVNATAGEACDDGGESAVCNADCTTAACGDGVTNMTAGEVCDDAGESATCNADCTTAACGDGVTNTTAGEVCDDAGESATCNADCTTAACGDGVTNMTAGEDCDDSGESATCNADCTTAACGDGQVNTTAGETCDDGGRSGMCDADCTAVTCGDGTVNATAGEECDGDGMGMGGETDTCDDDCTMAMCGDMVVNATAMEECDDGGESDVCDDDCTAAMCGDGTVNATAGEDCDGDGMGMGGETDMCNDDCTAATCGDGIVNATAGEDCDDSGESDVCNDDCTTAACGDGVVNATAGEECDDGNTDDGDGCAADCTEEAGGSTGGDSTGGVDETGGSGGESGVADSSGGPGPVTAADGSGTSGDTDTDSGGAVPGVGDDGCSCSTDGDRNGRNTLWSMLALFGLGALRRRRRA